MYSKSNFTTPFKPLPGRIIKLHVKRKDLKMPNLEMKEEIEVEKREQVTVIT